MKIQTFQHLEQITIGDAASLLGVSVSTLRNWNRAGKLRPGRHPINGYRLYERHHIEALKVSIRRAVRGCV